MLEYFICHFLNSTPTSMLTSPDRTPTEPNICVDEGLARPLETDGSHGLRTTSTPNQDMRPIMSTCDPSTRFRLPGTEGIPRKPQSLSHGITISTIRTINDYRVSSQRSSLARPRIPRLCQKTRRFIFAPFLDPANEAACHSLSKIVPR